MNKVYEVESKHKLSIPVDDFIGALTQNGFKELAQKYESDTYYSRPDVDYMKTVECLRIRETDMYAEVTYKPATVGKSTGITTKPETDVRLESIEQAAIAKQLLDNIGMIELVCVAKSRRCYTRRSAENNESVFIDTIDGIGEYIEIEIISSDPKAALSAIQTIEKTLHVTEMPRITEPYRDIVMRQKDR